MALIVETFKCYLCGTPKEVVHLGRPTIRDFHNSELLKNCDGTDKHVCYECESERMSDDEE